MSDFLPEGYEVKATSDQYMKLEQGDNRFRILASPIIGQEWWTEDAKKNRFVHRRRKGERISPEELGEDPIREFWAMPVFDYKDKKIKILELTQKGVMRSIQNLSRDEDWGNPKGVNGYDLVIMREGEGRETKYDVQPKPHKKLDEGVMRLFADMKINLEAMYDGGDPFATEDVKASEEVDVDEIERVLGGGE
jgi:hypothetical protein